MKTVYTLAAVFAVAAAAAAVLIARRDGGATAARPVRTSVAPVAVLGVDELMRNVDQHPGPVTVEGVVGAVSGAEVALIDCGEFEQCGVVTCAELTLPVRWSGPLPVVKQKVRVRGQVQEAGGKLVFVAQSLEASGGTSEDSDK